MRSFGGAALLLGATALGCGPLPEIEYETDHLRLATDFSDPVCAGTLRMLDRAAGRIAASLDPGGAQDPYVLYWLEDELLDFCDEGSTGCFYPGTRIAFARGESLTHELVHVTIDSPGRAYFMEEGLAELYSGAPVRHDPDDLRGELVAQLELSQHDYQHGALSYTQAAHFAHWVRHSEGEGAMARLAAALGREGGESEIREQLEAIFGTTIWGVEQHYGREAPRLYPGLYDEQVELQVLDDSALWLSTTLDCEDEEVIGPLPDGEGSMAQQLRLKVPEAREARMRLDGDPGTWVEVLRPYASGQEYFPPWWPSSSLRSRVARLQPGDQTTVHLNAGTYLVVLGASGSSPGKLDLQILRD